MHERTIRFERAVDLRATLDSAGVEYLESNEERAVALFGGEVLRLLAAPSLGETEQVDVQVWERPTSQTDDWEGLSDRFVERVERHATERGVEEGPR